MTHKMNYNTWMDMILSNNGIILNEYHTNSCSIFAKKKVSHTNLQALLMFSCNIIKIQFDTIHDK